MAKILGRPGRLLMPLAIAVCALLGCEKAAGLMLAILTARIFSLCAGAALRRAATRLVSGARLTGNYYLALIMGVIGGGAAVFAMTRPAFGGFFTQETALAGALIMLAQLAADGLYAIPDSISGNACDALIGLYTAAGLMVSGGNSLLLISACGICLVAAVALSLALRRKLGFSMGAQVVKGVPMAILRTGLPALAFFAAAYRDMEHVWIYAAFWAVFEAMEAPIRRGEREGHWLNIACVATAFAGAALCVALDEPGFALAAFLVLFFLMACCAQVKWRMAGLMAVTMLALAAAWGNSAGYSAHLGWLSGALCAAAMCMTIPDIKTAYIRLNALMKKRRRG